MCACLQAAQSAGRQQALKQGSLGRRQQVPVSTCKSLDMQIDDYFIAGQDEVRCTECVHALQAERDAKRYGAFEKKATLTAQAERLKSSMKESQLTHFRTETKSR